MRFDGLLPADIVLKSPAKRLRFPAQNVSGRALHNFGVSFSNIRRLLEGVAELQNGRVVVVPSDDLDSDWQAGFGKCAGHGEGGVSYDRDVIG
jgi:hypothetical protein